MCHLLQQVGSDRKAQRLSLEKCSSEQPVTDCVPVGIPDPQSVGSARSVSLSLLVSELSDRPVLVQLTPSTAESAEPACDAAGGGVASQPAAEPDSSRAGSSISAQTAAAVFAGRDDGKAVPSDKNRSRGLAASANASKTARLSGFNDDNWLSELPAAPSAPVIIKQAASTSAQTRPRANPSLSALNAELQTDLAVAALLEEVEQGLTSASTGRAGPGAAATDAPDAHHNILLVRTRFMKLQNCSMPKASLLCCMDKLVVLHLAAACSSFRTCTKF